MDWSLLILLLIGLACVVMWIKVVPAAWENLKSDSQPVDHEFLGWAQLKDAWRKSRKEVVENYKS